MIVFVAHHLTCEVALDANVPGVETGKTKDDTVDDAATTNVAVAEKPHIISRTREHQSSEALPICLRGTPNPKRGSVYNSVQIDVALCLT